MYKETQKFRQPWLWALLVYSMGVVIYSGQLVGVAIMLLVMALFWFLTLQTRIDQEGISYRWFPFQSSYRLIKWSTTEKAVVRDYAAISEFGGWGIRFSWTGMAHTVAGHHGIEIKRKGKKRILLIGTQHPKEVRTILSKEPLPVI
ncbi:hypothetical protein [Spirosoma validum]|uniref:Uncharacterized protein n=1 Tax=Spirosoma validum TaxID=2771355 RepID=A0A927B948_9BACT|nr:hypothetical protein [Spirosoma validum]MBD2757471.1 hypothetical protein [Spirosoma validum]